MSVGNDNFSHLDLAGRHLAAAVTKPRAAVYLSMALGIALAWAMLAGMAREAALMAGPAGTFGDDILRSMPDIELPSVLGKFILLCLSPASATGFPAFVPLFAMWALMSIAMMLPSAAPLIRTYCEIADTAAAKGERAVHPFVLLGGYLAVWFAASMVFAGATLLVQMLVPDSSPVRPVPLAVGGAALLLAGLYQFSRFKEACLKKCRRPFTILFARWTTRPSGILRLGTEQGLWCLGCCWALMLVMFAVGLMNIFWMALIALFTLFEKQAIGSLPSRLAGAILLVWGAALILLSLRI
jgi:predicted metal-binding membrane protein